MGSEEFPNQMVGALDIIIDRRSNGRLLKLESQTLNVTGVLFDTVPCHRFR